MMRSLLVHVNLLQPLWHGKGDWPPSPFRLFQAMVAGAFGGRWAAEDKEAHEQRVEAFRWLERQRAPEISAPLRSECRKITSYVPNNDLDAVGGDLRRVAEIRAEKVISPVRLETSQTFLYAWHFEAGESEAKLLCDLAERLHTFGRGVDPAWARGEVVERESAEASLAAHGVVARPGGPSGKDLLPCPVEGSLHSLIQRHRATAQRFRQDPVSKRTQFWQPPKAHYQRVGYDRPPARLFFEIRRPDDLSRFARIPQVKASVLTEAVRDEAARRLSNVGKKYAALAERFVAGRTASAADLDRRVRIIPLSTIGHPQASPSIRRIAVEVPPECPVSPQDVEWAFFGLSPSNETGPQTSLTSAAILVPAQSHDMLLHYGWDREFARWRSVTPVALPMAPGRTRTGAERSLSEAQCTGAFVNSLRHAGITAAVAGIRIQREPFHAKGAVAEAFETSRFAGRLRHVEVAFQSPVRGPLVLGDGRFVGLGVMRPVHETPAGLHVFAVEQGCAVSRSASVARALRRAVMARAQILFGPNPLPLIFHGHEDSGAPARSGNHKHLFYAAFSSQGGDRIDRLALIAPGLCDRTISDRQHWNDVARAVNGISVLRCGRDGVLALIPLPLEADDSFFGSGRVWSTVNDYRPTRHPKRDQPLSSFIETDVRTECARRGFPAPESVQLLRTSEGPRGSLTAQLTITFAKPLGGPVLLGRESHLGCGLFRLT
jgi:CRISPR-associated protein Csb2